MSATPIGRVSIRCTMALHPACGWVAPDESHVAIFVEVQYVDRGLTIVHSIVWVLVGVATFFGLLFVTVMMGMASGD